MGIFSKVKKTVGGIIKNPTNLRNYADASLQMISGGQADTHGLNTSAFGLGKDLSIDDALLGKKAKDINPDEIANQLRATQSKGLGELNSALDISPEGIVRTGADNAKKSILATAQDARRNAQALMARTGLKGSSLGLANQRSIDQDAGAQVANVDASLPGQIRQQKINDATTRIQAGNPNLAGVNFNTIEGQRSGGLLGYASAAAPLAGGIGSIMTGSAALKNANTMSGYYAQQR